MKFSNIKNSFAFLALITASSMQIAHGSDIDAEQYRIECGKKVGATLALCLFQKNDSRTFLEYIQEWRKIIQEYSAHFEATTITLANNTLKNIESYITEQKKNNRSISASKIANFLTELSNNLPASVAKKLEETFEHLQMKLLKTRQPLAQWQLLTPLSNKLNAQ